MEAWCGDWVKAQGSHKLSRHQRELENTRADSSGCVCSAVRALPLVCRRWRTLCEPGGGVWADLTILDDPPASFPAWLQPRLAQLQTLRLGIPHDVSAVPFKS